MILEFIAIKIRYIPCNRLVVFFIFCFPNGILKNNKIDIIHLKVRRTIPKSLRSIHCHRRNEADLAAAKKKLPDS
eukprot:UN02191